MTQPLSVGFEDFKRLASNSRIYYFEGDSFIDLQFLFDGVIIKTTVMKDSITNPQAFFSDKMFTGAMKLNFRIPDAKGDIVSTVEEKKTEGNLIDISLIQDEETNPQDIQREGVREDDTI